MNPRSALRRALVGTGFCFDDEKVYTRNFEVPSGSGVGTARAIAQAYNEFATGGKKLGIREETLHELMAPPIIPTKGMFDQVLKMDSVYSLGFIKPLSQDPFGSPSAFGMPGTGGSFGFADPKYEIGYGYVLNGLGTSLPMDPRDIALRKAMWKSIGATDMHEVWKE